MNITYDMHADSVYIYLTEKKEIEVSHTYLCDPREVEGMINLDFDKEGKLIGIEVIGAKSKLPTELLKSAIILGKPILISEAKRNDRAAKDLKDF